MVSADRLSNSDVGAASSPPERDGQSYFRWALPLLLILGFLAFLPLWPPLLLAVWLANLFRPLQERLARRVHGRHRAAAVFTVACVVFALAPLAVLGLSLASAAVKLLQGLKGAKGAQDAFQALLASEPTLKGGNWDAQHVIGLVREHGGSAATAASTVFGATTAAVIGLFVFVYGFYVCLVDGRRAHLWLLNHFPLRREHTLRFSAAFIETGRGLLIGVGLTALFQGVIATIGYMLIGVPQPLVLGLVTVFAALIPSIGTGLVWVPVAAGLGLTGNTTGALLIVGLGAVISVADNFVRPYLSRHAKLDLPTFVLFAAMLGGLGTFGAWGILAGPLFVRLAVEGLRIWRLERELGADAAPRLIETGSVASETHVLHG
jgi:predicted PurR-regulated permease PerM